MPGAPAPKSDMIKHYWGRVAPSTSTPRRSCWPNARGSGCSARPSGPDSRVHTGMVEEFSRRRIDGWVAGPEGHPAGTHRRPAQRHRGHRVMGDRCQRRDQAQQLVRSAFVPVLPRGHLAASSRTSDRISVLADGVALPIYKVGLYLSPQRSGAATPDELRAQMNEGYVFEQYGKLSLSKQRDTEWQQRVMTLFGEVRAFVKERFGHDVFFIYGTLLGAVRDDGFIGHDIDLDCAFLSDAGRRPGGRGAAARHRVRADRRGLPDRGVPGSPARRERRGHADRPVPHLLRRAGFPRAAVRGRRDVQVRKRQWQGVREIDFPGGTGVVPVNAEQMVEHLYGADWRRPSRASTAEGPHDPRPRRAAAAERGRGDLLGELLRPHDVRDRLDLLHDGQLARGHARHRSSTSAAATGATRSRSARPAARVRPRPLAIGVQHAAKKAAQIGLGDRPISARSTSRTWKSWRPH